MLNVKQKTKLANKTANWIISSILRMQDKDLIMFFELLSEELKKRGIEDVRSCADFLD